MSYTPAFETVEVGMQTVWGTAVTPTAKLSLIEECEIEPIQESEVIPELRGTLAGNYTASLNKGGGEASLKGALCYEDIGYYLDSILVKNVSPTGAGPYVYLRDAPLSSIPARRLFTLVKGNSTNYSYGLNSGIINELNIKIESNQLWMFDAKLVGQKVAELALAGSSDRTATPIHANNTSLWIDAWAGTIGSTAISDAWFSAELQIKSNSDVVPTIGNQYPISYRDAIYEASLKLKIEVATATKAFMTALLGTTVTQKQIRIKGTTGATAIAQLDFAGTFKNAPKVEDENGVSSFEFELFHTYNPTLANWLKTSVTTSVAVLP